jgi:hypothetical protein
VFVALGIQHEKRICPVILSVACLAVPHFPTFSDKQHDVKKILTAYKSVFLLSPQVFSEMLFILRITERVVAINVHTYVCKVRVIVVRF